MKFLLHLEKADLAQAIVNFVEAETGNKLDPDVIDTENLSAVQIEVDTAKPKQKRKRRTKEEIAADEAAKVQAEIETVEVEEQTAEAPEEAVETVEPPVESEALEKEATEQTGMFPDAKSDAKKQLFK